MILVAGSDALPNVAIYGSYPNGCAEVQMNDSEIELKGVQFDIQLR
jgi:hypothetical protein